MSIQADQHLHSHHSGDSEAPMEDMANAALARGMTHICFTEHMDLDFPDGPDEPGSIFLLDVDAYHAEWETLAERFEGRLDIRFGLELGLQPQVAVSNQAIVADHSWDLIIGSCHIAEGRDPYYPSFYEGRSLEESYRAFFRSTLDNLHACEDIDVLGHLDYIVRYAPGGEESYHPEEYADITDEILRFIIERDIGLDINTSAMIRGCREPNPCTALIRRYRELGGELITIGSDAHRPEDVGGSFERVRDILLSEGYTRYYTYTGRRPDAHPL